MVDHQPWSLQRRTLLAGFATLAASTVIGGSQLMAAIEQNTVKRRGVGLIAADLQRASPGFTLFAPHFVENKIVYLIDLKGEVVHTWNLPYPPGLSGYLTERGTLLYNGRTPEQTSLSRLPFMQVVKGGAVLEVDWNGRVLWELQNPHQHHHAILLRNGNVLLHCLGEVPGQIAQRVSGGMAESNTGSGQYAALEADEVGKMYSDYIVEMTPKGETVWEWRSWDHLDPVTDGISEVQSPRTIWSNGNGLEELPDGNFLASFRTTSLVLRISRKTGEVLWKLGRPMVAGQHAPTLLSNGNILIFDNGVHRLDDPLSYSRVIEVDPATNKIVWKYQDKPAWNFFTPRMGNAQRLPNGNTLVNEAAFGRFFEVTKEGEIVWEYVNPHFGKPFFAGPQTSQTNQVFKALRYSEDEIARARGLG